MAVCGNYKHAKAHASLQLPSGSQAPALHLKDHAGILVLLTSSCTPNSPAHTLPP